MGVPTSEVGYTSAMHRREDYEVYKDMWGIGEGGGWNLCTFRLTNYEYCLFLFLIWTTNIGMRRIATFRSTTDRIYDGGPIRL